MVWIYFYCNSTCSLGCKSERCWMRAVAVGVVARNSCNVVWSWIERLDHVFPRVEMVSVVHRRDWHLSPAVVGDVVDRRLNDVTFGNATLLQFEFCDRSDGLSDPFKSKLGFFVAVRRWFNADWTSLAWKKMISNRRFRTNFHFN